MRLTEESHLFGRTIVEHDFPQQYSELMDVLSRTQVPLRDSGPFATGRGKPPKRQKRRIKGQNKYILLPADLPALNVSLDQQLRAKGWDRQPFASLDILTKTKDSSKGDFAKAGVFVEVEFGNTASMFRDLFKFQVANRERQGEVAVLVTAVKALARLHDSGITTYQKVEQLIPYMSVGVQMPIWIIGLEPDDIKPLRARYMEMFQVAEANGVECHPLDVALGYQGLGEPPEEATEAPLDYENE
jgi:hypothetical protein